jgi:DNA polymerase
MRFDSPQAAEATDYHLARVPETSDLGVLSKAAMHCQACPLYRNATQTVFGEGRLTAKIIFIGEQPGDQEDLAGKPFVGPAGRVLDQALEEVQIDRASCYVTNAVKHFKWKERGKRRLHDKPNAREIEACRPWLKAEIHSLKPEFIICLGATAVRATFGKDLPILKNRGHWMNSPFDAKTLITVHPSSILRAPDQAAKEKAFSDFVDDLRVLGKALREKR